MTRHSLGVTRLKIFPKGVFRSLPPNHATIAAEVAEQSLALHPTTTSSCLTSGGSARNDSSRLYSGIREIASLRLLRHSSRVEPCPVSARHLGAIGDIPRPVLLDDRGELVAHTHHYTGPTRHRTPNGRTAKVPNGPGWR